VAILTSAFTAIGTMTTAYFGIKSMSNTAQSYASPGPAAPQPGGAPRPVTSPTPAVSPTPAASSVGQGDPGF
jgi:hypothetical protein